MIYKTNSLEEMQKVAESFVESLSPYSDRAVVVGLYGNLGAGKTTFTQSVAKTLGVSDTVTSPTFVIEKIYELTNQEFTHLIHIDAYRLEGGDELVKLGWNEITADPNNLILIEWPERVENIMPEHIKISLRGLDDPNSREIEVEV